MDQVTRISESTSEALIQWWQLTFWRTVDVSYHSFFVLQVQNLSPLPPSRCACLIYSELILEPRIHFELWALFTHQFISSLSYIYCFAFNTNMISAANTIDSAGEPSSYSSARVTKWSDHRSDLRLENTYQNEFYRSRGVPPWYIRSTWPRRLLASCQRMYATNGISTWLFDGRERADWLCHMHCRCYCYQGEFRLYYIDYHYLIYIIG